MVVEGIMLSYDGILS